MGQWLGLVGGGLFALVAALGCSSGSGSGGGGAGTGGTTGGGDCTGACNHLTQCDPSTPAADCSSLCTSSFSPACTDAIKAASCAELAMDVSQNPPWANACFPPCSTPSSICNGGVVTACKDGHQITIGCQEACNQGSLTYSGVCASSYQGQTCSNGGECCWCQ